MKKVIIILIAILILTYILVFIKIINYNKITCKLVTKRDLYEKKEKIEINYKKNKMIINEEYISNNDKILDLKYEEYINEKYKINKSKNKINAKKEIKIENSKDTIKKLTNEGYQCK